MEQRGDANSFNDKGALVQCAACMRFRHFSNSKGHNSPQALGECRADPWDGNRGQWPHLRHPCNDFLKRETNPVQADER
ncbi:MAG: hypothetical protein DRG82_02040 [Deltaproteobacteria bacterium]|nr:MAG: hypothetical protein B1H13_10485 [Desulfobacteraceae bacterium 4484_190.3]RLB19141.1 MAG: hypothetical protein DRG82_02040 [Deltaproteobacteria bacterium]